MDSDDEMMLFLLQDEENVATDQDEHLTLLAALLQIQVDDVHNATPLVDVQNLG
jgi:hypothetical protein